MTFDQNTPLNRIKGETIKAHSALMDYFLMFEDRDRSLEKLRRRYAESTPEKALTVHLRTLKGWSARYHWQARIARQIENDNAIILEQRQLALEQIEAEFRQRHMSQAEALAILADQARGNMADFAAVQAQSDLSDNPKAALVKTVTQHYIQTAKGAGEDGQSEIKARFALGLYDAQGALKLILQHHGAFAADNKRQNLNIDMSNLTDEQLNRISKGEDPLNVISSD